MKTRAILVFAIAVLPCMAFSQPCLPEGISFTTQEGIDNFEENYPGCSEIEGMVIISGTSIENLIGLSPLTHIGGGLTIFYTGLTSLAGLENLVSVEGGLSIDSNWDLTALTGLENLVSVGGLGISNNTNLTGIVSLENLVSNEGILQIYANSSLNSLSGLENLSSIGGYLEVWGNTNLESLNGLEGLTSIGGHLDLYGTHLTSLMPLQNVTTIDGWISISENNLLISLAGLENIETGSITDMHITNNDLLSECDVQSICDYLASPNGDYAIEGNASGCSNVQEVGLACGIPCLNDYFFSTQAEIDSFQDDFPGCTEIEGDMIIGVWGNSSDVTNLDGLSVITSIGGDLNIGNSPLLTSLTGLENLSAIGGNLDLWWNNSLASLTGLENLISIGGDLDINHNAAITSLAGLESLTYLGGDLLIWYNASLTGVTGLENVSSIGGNLNILGNDALISLDGLENLISIGGALGIGNPALTSLEGLQSLTSIGGNLSLGDNESLISLAGLENVSSIGGNLIIHTNTALASLAGLENIDPGSIDSLWIGFNTVLSECEVQSICEYLVAPGGWVAILDNAPGCNSIEEVEEACESQSIKDRILLSFTLQPNPAENGSITITLDNPQNLQLNCFNIFGQRVHQQEICSAETVINVSKWTPGMYLVVVYEQGMPVGRAKFVKT